MKKAMLVLFLMSSAGCPTGADFLDTPGPEMHPRFTDESLPRWSHDRHFAESIIFEQPSHSGGELGYRMYIDSTIPWAVDDCRAKLSADPVCDDRDEDGIADEWEWMILNKLRPAIRMHVHEKLLWDVDSSILMLGRVTPHTYAHEEGMAVMMMIGYSHDYGRCTYGAHHGDSERIAFFVRPDPDPDGPLGPSSVMLNVGYFAAHEGTSSDNSRRSQLKFINDPKTFEPRVHMLAALNKHASYASRADCRTENLCGSDACGSSLEKHYRPGYISASPLDLFLPIVQAGEPDAAITIDEDTELYRSLPVNLRDELDDPNQPGFQFHWRSEEFCGGATELYMPCSSPAVEKMEVPQAF